MRVLLTDDLRLTEEDVVHIEQKAEVSPIRGGGRPPLGRRGFSSSGRAEKGVLFWGESVAAQGAAEAAIPRHSWTAEGGLA